MARGLEDGLLRFCNGAWRDDDGDAVDIAEVVRCKDCRHGVDELESEYYLCNRKMLGRLRADDFCSYGERRTE